VDKFLHFPYCASRECNHMAQPAEYSIALATSV
jgi:hypothetical protein